MDGEGVRLREIYGDEIDPILHQPRYEGDGPRETIQLGDHKRRPPKPALAKSLFQRRTIMPTAALDFLELGNQETVADEATNGLSLGFEA